MKLKLKIHTQILIAILAGVLIGFLLNQHIEHVHIEGEQIAREDVVCKYADTVKLIGDPREGAVNSRPLGGCSPLCPGSPRQRLVPAPPG